jgi:hypothetical protein
MKKGRKTQVSRPFRYLPLVEGLAAIVFGFSFFGFRGSLPGFDAPLAMTVLPANAPKR